MMYYIARGEGVWTASLSLQDALIRCARQVRDPLSIVLCSTRGDWSVDDVDGTLTSSDEITRIEVDIEMLAGSGAEAINDAIIALVLALPDRFHHILKKLDDAWNELDTAIVHQITDKLVND